MLWNFPASSVCCSIPSLWGLTVTSFKDNVKKDLEICCKNGLEPERYELQCKVQMDCIYRREDERKHDSSFQIMKKKCESFMLVMSETRSDRLRLQSGKFRWSTRKTFFGSENSETVAYVAYEGFGIPICCNKRLNKYLQELDQ